MKNNVKDFLNIMAKNNMAFRGTLEDLVYLMGFDENEIKNAVFELIDSNEIAYIVDEDVYTLTVKGDMEE